MLLETAARVAILKKAPPLYASLLSVSEQELIVELSEKRILIDILAESLTFPVTTADRAVGLAVYDAPVKGDPLIVHRIAPRDVKKGDSVTVTESDIEGTVP